MQIDEQKAKLIAALEIENNRMKNNGFNTEDGDATIEYLKSGSHNISEIEEDDMENYFPLLYAAIHDYDTLLSDYTS